MLLCPVLEVVNTFVPFFLFSVLRDVHTRIASVMTKILLFLAEQYRGEIREMTLLTS